jgi:glyoxylase-like metal-dependent hydrolase (beta-lactamase superfamily II)
MAQKRPPKVTIIKAGTLCHEASESTATFTLQLKSELGIGGGSTVTLIKSDRTILVDTGFDFEWLSHLSNCESNTRNLTHALKEAKVAPDDIDIVFITHWHKDHFGNLSVFKNAQYMASKGLIERFNLDHFIGVMDQQEIAEGVKVICTPGHTVDHASILVETAFKGVHLRIVVAGDAVISHSYFQLGQVWRDNADFFQLAAARESVLRIIDRSDIVVPGHGVPFLTYQPAWIKSLVR